MQNLKNKNHQNAGQIFSRIFIYIFPKLLHYMEDGNINLMNEQISQNRNIIVKASQILKKLRTYQDRKNFALENSKNIIQ